MLKNALKSIITAFILFTLLFILTNTTEIYAGQSSNSARITMYTNMSKTITPAGITKDAEWKTSNARIVSILGTNNGNVTLKSGKKTGSCTVTAVTDNASYKYKVTVKSDRNISRATLVSVKQTKNQIQLRIKINNRSNKDSYYGYSYRIEKFADGKWKKMPVNIDMAFPAVAISVPTKSSVTRTYTIDSDKEKSYYLRKDFTKGTYRIYVETAYAKKAFKYVIFTVK